MPRERVTLQVSLDSAGPALHDDHRGPGSHARTLAGVAQARDLGFTVRIAATLHEDEIDTAASLHALLDTLGIDPVDRLIRPVAKQGYAEHGQTMSIDTLQPEPHHHRRWDLAASGRRHRPGPAGRRPSTPAGTRIRHHLRDTLALQNAAHREGLRRVFRCV